MAAGERRTQRRRRLAERRHPPVAGAEHLQDMSAQTRYRRASAPSNNGRPKRLQPAPASSAVVRSLNGQPEPLTAVANSALWAAAHWNKRRTVVPDGERTPVDFAWASRSTSSRTPRYRLEPAAKIPRSRYKSRTRGTTNTRPHQRPVAQSTTTMTAIQTARSSRITTDDFRCRRSQFIVVQRYDQSASGTPYGNPRC
jgi:hypothetical protein